MAEFSRIWQNLAEFGGIWKNFLPPLLLMSGGDGEGDGGQMTKDSTEGDFLQFLIYIPLFPGL